MNAIMRYPGSNMVECNRNNRCVDCDDITCMHCGELEADCPKYLRDFLCIPDCKNCTEFYCELDSGNSNQEKRG